MYAFPYLVNLHKRDEDNKIAEEPTYTRDIEPLHFKEGANLCDIVLIGGHSAGIA